MNKPPTFLFLSDSLVKEREAYTLSGITLHQRRADSPVARPMQPTLSDEVRGTGSKPAASGSRRLEPANRPVNRSIKTPKRPSRPTPRDKKDSDRPIQSPGSAPLHQSIPKTTRTPPHQPVDRGAPSVKMGIGDAPHRVNR